MHASGAEISGETLASVLAALAAQSEVRIEDKRLRAAILIATPDRLADAVRALAPARFEPLSRIPTLAERESASTHDGNVLVIRTDGRIAGRVSAWGNERLDLHLLASRLGAEFGLRVLDDPEDPEPLIEVWRHGEHVADYAFVVRAGVWRLRTFAPSARELAAVSDFSPTLLEDLVRKAIRFSYAHGSILVAWNGRLPSYIQCQRPKRNSKDFSEAEFEEYAAKDGGCIVSSDGTLKHVQVMFPTSAPTSIEEGSPGAFARPSAACAIRCAVPGTRVPSPPHSTCRA